MGQQPHICPGCTLHGQVVNNSTDDAAPPFYCVRFDDEQSIKARLTRLGKAYARRHQLGWNLSPPRSWRLYAVGPHVTLNHLPDAASLHRRNARVRLGELKAKDTGRSRWVMYDVDVQLESRRGSNVFRPLANCGPYPFHVSVAQEHLRAASRRRHRHRHRARTRRRRNREAE